MHFHTCIYNARNSRAQRPEYEACYELTYRLSVARWQHQTYVLLQLSVRPQGGFMGEPLLVRPMLRDRCHVLSVCNIGVLWPNGWMDQDATWYGDSLCPGDVVVDGDPAFPRKGAQQLPTFRPMSFRPMSIVAKRSPISPTASSCSSSCYIVYLHIFAMHICR